MLPLRETTWKGCILIMNTIMTKKEAVKLYGSEECKVHFEKYGKFKNKSIEEGLIKTLRQHYDSIETVKQGRAFVYKLGAKREVIAEREDNRVSNGDWSIPYTKNMDIMVVSVLEQGLVAETAQPLSKWAVDFGLITPQMYGLLKARYNEYLRASHIQELRESKVILDGEDRILDDFTYIVKEINNQLAGTLNRMQKAGIIEFYPVYKGHIKETDETINLHENTVKEILSLQRNLMEQYNVNEWYLAHYQNAPRTKEYNKVWEIELARVKDEKGEVLGLDYFYKLYAIMLKATKKKIIKYLEKYNMEAIEGFKRNEELFLTDNENTFYKERHDYVVVKAQKAERKFLSKNTVELDETLKMFFDEDELARRNFTFDKKYYALYFDRKYAQRIKELQEYYGHTFN